ncbi:uncharacterized protein LOC131301564 [Rhododendron vialii]|uniref:uncharacterized protein LOC131301564 n=1 Tax=Rhododendron vialii TaxID=182163 RepID=UPI00265D8883|nr:uncharacterized protein LOC131301564 [Rhododendron vialii]
MELLLPFSFGQLNLHTAANTAIQLIWNREKLKGCIPDSEVQEVCKIPISYVNFSDCVIWRHTKNGEFSVKSGYAQRRMRNLTLKPATPSCSFIPSEVMWKKLWSIPTAPKVRMFMWKAAQNWVACRENLFCRKCITNPTCPICASTNETIEHLLFHCPRSRAVWFGSGKAYWVLQREITAVNKWIEELLYGCLAKESSREIVGAIFDICWAIWKARNSFVFNGRKLNPTKVIEQAGSANVDYLQTIWKGLEEGLPRPSRVVSLAAFDILARDSGGLALAWQCVTPSHSVPGKSKLWLKTSKNGQEQGSGPSRGAAEYRTKQLTE